MTWQYQQSTGELSYNGEFEGTGYSGTGVGWNNPAQETVPNVGPIPTGNYMIGAAYDDIGGLGPCVMHLDPDEDTDTYDRSLFRIHGDNVNHDASHGCIILGPAIRRKIAASADRALVVIA
jgi:Protein of unknown function (DUF2778)